MNNFVDAALEYVNKLHTSQILISWTVVCIQDNIEADDLLQRVQVSGFDGILYFQAFAL